MPEAYIVDALRSPTGKRKGALSDVHAIDLGAQVLVVGRQRELLAEALQRLIRRKAGAIRRQLKENPA